ncbi:bifunctional phosphopantothenoylcysteine decarboxylase/phosphopantothenate--cysteine ligase CoaBC [Clostridia bacterium OttesenSCG-928-F22]|nr:bifunctional phosphopantothenoylcysteine decarboxylase/phosphopantothenate--cysteine ligase CoaBC [Clostridia bacterium OttesenSCG-928-F22]
MNRNKTVVLGVTGSIAAYKAPDIASSLVKMGYDVKTIMTHSAAKFISPLTMESITKNPVCADMWVRSGGFEVEHISLAKAADVFAIAPASANIIGKYAHGIADDMLSTTIMATRAPVVIAPAMNTNMYESTAVQQNMEILRGWGCTFVDPASGRLACGDIGKGKLAPVESIVTAIHRLASFEKDCSGLHILITAGPTREPIDPVRYISNRSSGKMGYAIAEAAMSRGAEVTLVSGPVALAPPDGVNLVNVETTGQMFDAVMAHFDACDIVIKSAAPADFTPSQYVENKIKKAKNSEMAIALSPTRDILKALGAKKGNKVLVGFAAETQNLDEYAKTKLTEKNVDMIVANDVTAKGAGFGTDTNIVTLLTKEGASKKPIMSKAEVAHMILDEAVGFLNK